MAKRKRDTRFNDFGSFFGLLSGGGKATIKRTDITAANISAGYTGSDRFGQKQTEVFLPRRSSFETKLLGAGRSKFSPLGATEILEAKLGSDVANIWDSLENVRVAQQTAQHYHNSKVMKEFYESISEMEDPFAFTDKQAVTGGALTTEMLRMGIDVPSPNAHPIINRMRRKFDRRVQDTLASNDRIETIRLSAEIADFLRIETQPRRIGRKPKGEEDVNGTTLQGTDIGDVNDAVEAKDKAERSQQKASQELKSNEQAEKQGNSNEDVAGTAKNPIVDSGSEHRFRVKSTEVEPIQLSSHTTLALDETKGLWHRDPNKFRGIPTSDIWKLGLYGDTAVFKDVPKVRGKVAIMVDMSSSMGCPCEGCSGNTSYRRRNGNLYFSPAWLAWQAAGAIMMAFPESVAYTYAGSYGSLGKRVTYYNGVCDADITEVPIGNQPVHGGIYGGSTPTCCGALYLKRVVTSDLGASAAVLVTDGYPDRRGCTANVNRGFSEEGVRFATVMVNHDGRNMETVFPSESSVSINTEEDLIRLQQTMRFLAEVRR